MAAVQILSVPALRAAVGKTRKGTPAQRFPAKRLAGLGDPLAELLRGSVDDALTVLEAAVAGEWLWDFVAPSTEYIFRAGVRTFLDGVPRLVLPELDTDARRRVLRELSDARRAGPLAAGGLPDLSAVAEAAAKLAGEADPAARIAADFAALAELADRLAEAGFPATAGLLRGKPAVSGPPLIASAVRLLAGRRAAAHDDLSEELTFAEPDPPPAPGPAALAAAADVLLGQRGPWRLAWGQFAAEVVSRIEVNPPAAGPSVVAPPPAGPAPDGEQGVAAEPRPASTPIVRNRVLEHFARRLHAAVGRSPLIKVAIAGTRGRLLDLSLLEPVAPGAAGKLLAAVTDGAAKTNVDLRRRGDSDKAADELYELLDKRMRLHAELARRETGVHALWLGWPLLYARGGSADGEGDEGFTLAPVLLWPVAIEPDRRTERRLRIGRAAQPDTPRANGPLAAWIRRELGVEPAFPAEEDLPDLRAADLPAILDKLAAQLSAEASDWAAPPVAVPDRKALRSGPGRRLIPAAVMGYFRWQNEAILADLDDIRRRNDARGVMRSFTAGERPGRTSLPIALPAEEDRFLVGDADFSQERVVWQARSGPGLVVHGPPGTGKSQTIVNVIADALAHGRTVLMVCQKQAAIRVVAERLKAAGLGDLCLEIEDAELDRRDVIRAVRAQVDGLPRDMPADDDAEAKRRRLARQISDLERELEAFATALHARHAKSGLSYREVLAREQAVLREWPSAKPLQGAAAEAAGELDAVSLEDAVARAESVGGWFAAGDALNNPWRAARWDTVTDSPALRAEIAEIAAKLAELDAAHTAHAAAHGLGIPLPEDLPAFAAAGAEALPRVRELAEPAGAVALAWLKAIRGRPEAETSAHTGRVREAEALAAAVSAAPLDDGWERTLGPKWADQVRLMELRGHADYVSRRAGKWWRWLDPLFHMSAAAVRQVRRDAVGGLVFTAAEALPKWIEARRLREKLAAANAALVPGRSPSPVEGEGRGEGDGGRLGPAAPEYPAAARAGLERAQWLLAQAKQHPWMDPLLDAAVAGTGLPAAVAEVRKALDRLPRVNALLSALAGLDPHLTPEALAEPVAAVRAGASIGGWVGRLTAGLSGLPALRNLDRDRRDRKGAIGRLLDGLEKHEADRAAGKRGTPHPPETLPTAERGRWWAALVRLTAAAAWREMLFAERPELESFSPDIHADKVKRLAKLLDEKRPLEADVIRRRWLARQIPVRDEPWNRMFQERTSKHGTAKRLREAVDLSWDRGLPALRPCWLMNPSSAGQVLPLRPELFDVVIFDEASQCPVEQALPAIYRGRSLVVSGDEKQLPPTAFFAASADFDDPDAETPTQEPEASADPVGKPDALQRLDEDHLLAAADLLAACIGTLPEQWLSVHYRSEHPALIEFSNRAFYGGRLEAPPARVVGVKSARPIVYHHAGGTYADRTNPAEAAEVVRRLREVWLGRFPSPLEGEPTGVRGGAKAASAVVPAEIPTLGVVTFNQPQRELIEERLEAAAREDEAFAEALAVQRARRDGNQDVGFFVKNLENVQGDERDVMIFSTTFGPDAAGKFARRFGPVGMVGGHRRLNVAVTRAKRRVELVGSLPIERVADALNGTAGDADGLTPAAYLQLYLAYAKAVSEGDEEAAARVLDRLGEPVGSTHADPVRRAAAEPTPLERDVADLLTGWGYVVRFGVGQAGFRLDLAVSRPDDGPDHLLGIECDGGRPTEGRTARVWEVWRPGVLARRGWRLHRIWSASWWTDRPAESKRLRTALEAAKAGR